MAEAIGLVAAITQLAVYTFKTCEYADQITNAPREKSDILREASLLYTLLIRLEKKVAILASEEYPPPPHWLERDVSLRYALVELQSMLEELLGLIEKSGRSKIRTVRWPFDKKRCQELLTRIERVKSTVHGILLETSRYASSPYVDSDQNQTNTDEVSASVME